MSTFLSHTLPRWGRDLVFQAAGLLTGIVALVLWNVGVMVSMSLAITYVGLIVSLGTLLALQWLARVERRRAAIVLGEPISERYRPTPAGPPRRWTTHLHDLMGEAAIWRDFAWAALWGYVGPVIASVAIGLWIGVLGLITLPLYYWSIPGGADYGIVSIDTLATALGVAGIGLLLVPICGSIVRGLTVVELAAMGAMLRGRASRAATAGETGTGLGAGQGTGAGAAPAAALDAPSKPPALAPAFELHVAFSLLIAAVMAIIWIATGGGYFWPVWVWFGLAIAAGLHLLVLRALQARGDREQQFRVRLELCGLITAICWVVWALSGGGYLWPFWPMLGMGTTLAIRAIFVFRERLPWVREQALVERVDVLTRTRQGALDVQAAELRRIERDLHDGAQARLVALSMRLGRAEERLADQPEIAALVREARADAGAAIGELRDLARGIAPPILADRGLTAAIEALARRAAIGVTIEADPDRRPLPVVETAAYFVVAEALTNVAKHAGGAAAHVRVTLEGDDLVLEIADEGPGGADPAGSGLTGLRSRVEALDGTLSVASPAGGGTIVRAQLPCGR